MKPGISTNNKQQVSGIEELVSKTSALVLCNFAFFLLLTFPFIVFGQSAADEYWPGGIEIDFGEIAKRGEEHYDTLLLHNPTQEAFVIENIRQSCGCTAVDWPNTPIEPGQTIPIQIAFRCTKGGYVERHLDIFLSNSREKNRIFVLADCPKL